MITPDYNKNVFRLNNILETSLHWVLFTHTYHQVIRRKSNKTFFFSMGVGGHNSCFLFPEY